MTRDIVLSEEEAFALLELCLHADVIIDTAKVSVMHKVADVCRDFVRDRRPFVKLEEDDTDFRKLQQRVHKVSSASL